ncbi:MAG: hypothetical protein K0R38_2095 [Polyangiaceae bacterium]|nr:hypothetical protein [Polyangiaceae bacterium]
MPAGDFDVEVLYFAALRDLSGMSGERVPLKGALSVAGLLVALEERHEALRGRLQSVRVAVNEEFTELSTELRGGEVVALIPPVSGG